MPQNHITFPKMAYPDNPEVASSYSFQIYGLRETVVSYRVWSEMGVQKLTGENLKVASAEFSTLS
jgi:hypothetical protein